MTEYAEGIDQPHPRGAFNHPVTQIAIHVVSQHAPGFQESVEAPRTEQAAQIKGVQAKLPPSNPEIIPKTGLAERIMQRFAQKEVAK